jgi:hypothetical protein
MATNNFDPTKYGATPFNPSEHGAIPISETSTQETTAQQLTNLGAKIMRPGAEMTVGAVKGALSTLATVPIATKNLYGGRLGILSAAQDVKSYQSQAELAKATTQLIKTARTISNREQRDALLDMVEKNMETLSLTSGAMQKGESEKANLASVERPEWLKPQTTAEKIGFTAERIGEFFAGSKDIKTVGDKLNKLFPISSSAPRFKNVVNTAARILSKSGVEGLNSFLVKEAQTQNIQEAKRAGLTTAAVSAPFKLLGEVVPQATTALSSRLKESAKEQYIKALKPIGKQDKALAESIVPDLLKKRIRILSTAGSTDKVAAESQKIGEQISDAYSKLPEGTRFNIAPTIKILDDEMQKILSSNGTILDPAKAKIIGGIQLRLLRAAEDGSLLPEDIRKIQQVSSSFILKGGNYFTASNTDKALSEIEKVSYGSVMDEFSKQLPSISKLNHLYHIYESLETLLNKMSGKSVPPVKQVAQDIGAATLSMVGGGGVKDVAVAVTGWRILSTLIKSPAWQTTSAVTKQILAENIVKGNWKFISDFIPKLVAPTTTGIK